MTLRHLPWRRPTGSSPTPDGFVEERRRLVLLRLRAVSLVASGPLALAAALNVWAFRNDRLWEHLTTLSLQASLMGIGIFLAAVPRAHRWGRAATVAISLGVGVVQLWAIAIAGTDVDLMISAVLAVILVPMLAFPWGPGPQAVLSTLLAVGYLWIASSADLDQARIGNLVIGTLVGFCVSVGGAWALDRQRRATFVERERVAALAHQRELLLDVGRRLNGTMDVEALVTLIARLGQQLVDCDATTFTLVDRGTRRQRVVALMRGRAEPTRYDFPVEARIPALADLLARRGIVEVPGDDDLDAVVEFGRRYGVARSLLVAVERDGERLGILTFNRRQPEPRFTEPQRRLAEGIAHQAAIALANARLVDDLQRASRVKSEFLSTMSHELRTPLNVILGFAEIGCDATATATERIECFTKIDVAGRDLLELVESTLAISRFEAGRDAPELVATPFRATWAAIRAVCERFPRAAGVRLDWPAEAPDVELVTDARKLQVVLRNLVGNALKFTTEGAVRVTADADDEHLVIAVEDTGIGIPPESHETIFEMFRQADGSDTRRFGGTGLGLYIVRQYVRQLGGSVQVASAPGAGATFTVRLPRSAAAQQAA